VPPCAIQGGSLLDLRGSELRAAIEGRGWDRWDSGQCGVDWSRGRCFINGNRRPQSEVGSDSVVGGLGVKSTHENDSGIASTQNTLKCRIASTHTHTHIYIYTHYSSPRVMDPFIYHLNPKVQPTDQPDSPPSQPNPCFGTALQGVRYKTVPQHILQPHAIVTCPFATASQSFLRFWHALQ
jgi:hypothetical protein